MDDIDLSSGTNWSDWLDCHAGADCAVCIVGAVVTDIAASSKGAVGAEMSKERLTCQIDSELKAEISAFGLSLSRKKGSLSKAYRHLLVLAFADPDFAPRQFPESELETVTLEAKSDEVQALDEYQAHHLLGERRKGFKSALLLGWTIHLAQNGR